MKLFFGISLLFWFTVGYAQKPLQTVKGKITDKETKEILPGASIKLVDTDTIIGAIADTSGSFTCDVPIGRRSFLVTYTGYENLLVSDVLVTTGKEVVLNIELNESVTNLKEVVVEANKLQPVNSMTAVSAHLLRPQDASHYAGGLFDPSRMVTSFAGVGAVDVDLNEIVIRGNSPKGILWRLEGIEIPNPNHFPDGQGGSGGSLSMISSDLLSNFDFLTGAFPAEYGNATSGVIDLNLRKGNPDTYEATFLFGDVGTQGTLEGPIAKGYKGSFLINYRYATLALVDKLHLANLGDNNVPSKFQDITFSLNLPTSKWGTFELFGVGGNNSTGTDAIKDSTRWTDWDQRRDEHENHNLGILGLKYQYIFPNHRTYLKTVVASTTQYDLWDKGYIVQDYVRQTEHREQYTNHNTRATLMLNHSFNARSSVRGGIIYSNLWADMFEENYLWHKKEFETNINRTGETSLWQAYLETKYRFTNRLEIFGGVHWLMLQLNRKYSVEPRLSLKYSLNNNHIFTYGSGIHSRMEALPLYFANVLYQNIIIPEGNKNLGLSKAFHNVIGYEYIPNQKIRFKAEAYYQYLFNVPIDPDTSNNFSTLNLAWGLTDFLLKNKGAGRNYGLELTLEKFYENNYYFLATVSFFDSRYRLANGNWYNTNFDSKYITNFLIGKDFKVGKTKINTFGLNLKTMYRGGFRATPIDLGKSILADRAVYIINETNTQGLPNVFELDFGTNYRKNARGFAWTVSLDVQNILNHENILVYEYRGSSQSVVTVRGMGIVPVANFKIEF
jgi:hypothetical protein